MANEHTNDRIIKMKIEEESSPKMLALLSTMKGDPGPYFTPAVAADGEITWTNNGGLPNPSPANIKGPQGNPGATGPAGVGIASAVMNLDDTLTLTFTDGTTYTTPVIRGIQGAQGPAGAAGAAATVTVGSVTTVNPTDPATVVNSGTVNAAVLDFEIPKGAAGNAGADGADGAAATIAVGTVTSVPNSSPATVTNTGTSNAAVFDFEIPTGPAGAKGADGSNGAAATIAVGSVTTVEPTDPATVVNSGTSSAAVFDFEIPRGAAGATGPQGQPGPTGPYFTPSVNGTTGDISWTNNGGLPNPTTVNIKGPQGNPGTAGADGADGDAATIAVGSVTTGNPGTTASVTNSGTANAAVFDFVIPRGNTGAPGADGADGAAATIAVGTVTTGNPGTNASVTNSGTSSAAVLDFVIPRGDPGTTVDVESGTWTPTASTSKSYTRQSGWYLRVGKMVVLGFEINFTPNSTSTDIYISNLPFTPGGTSVYGGGGGLATGLNHAEYGNFSGFYVTSSHIYPRQNTTSNSSGANNSSNMKATSTSTAIIMTGTVSFTIA